MSRWTKRSQAKREALLKEAAPDLEERQWLVPRYTYLRERLYVHARSQRRRRQLIHPSNGQHSIVDNSLSVGRLGSWTWTSQQNVSHGQRYGALVDWEEKPAHRADIIGFSRASLVLEAQAYLMEVLSNIVTKILDGVDSSQPPRIDKWRDLVGNAAFKETRVVEFWSPYTNQAFSQPPEFDSKYLLSLAKTRLDATGDHLWCLQCDAAYMRRHLKIMFATEIFKKASDSQKGQMLVRRIRDEVRSHHWWRWIEIECRHVDALRDRFRDSVYPGAPLPTDYDRALGALELLLVNQVIYRARCLEELLPYVLGLQEHWSLEPPVGQPNVIGFLRRKKPANTQESLTNDPLDWCLVQLLAKPDDQGTFDHSMLFAMLQEHMSKHPSEKARLDEVIYQVLSDPATCHEMLMAVRFHRPQNVPRTVEEVKRTEDRPAWRRRPRFRGDVEGLGVVPQGVGMSLVQNFYLANAPVGPKNYAWLAQSRQLRATLEKFWEPIRKSIQEDFQGSDFNPPEVDSLVEMVSANLSEQYLQDKQGEYNAILAVIREQDAPQAVANLFDKAESRPAATMIAPPRPEKTKTRGDARHSVENFAAAYDGSTTCQRKLPQWPKLTPSKWRSSGWISFS
ncbi:hypothetical protein VCV18_011393 [Metarhizium anisopliae]